MRPGKAMFVKVRRSHVLCYVISGLIGALALGAGTVAAQSPDILPVQTPSSLLLEWTAWLWSVSFIALGSCYIIELTHTHLRAQNGLLPHKSDHKQLLLLDSVTLQPIAHARVTVLP